MRLFTLPCVVALAALWAGAPVQAQGPLDPDSGPAEMMKSLDQIEPRTPITALPYTITESGSYFLTGDLSSSGDGIIVEADSVTIDLMGYAMSGTGNDIGLIADGQNSVTVRNGVIEGFEIGIRAMNAQYGRYEGVTVKDNTATGIGLMGWGDDASGNVIANASVLNNGLVGIHIGTVAGGTAHGNMVLNTAVMNNQRNGIRIVGDDGRATGNVIRDCVVSGSTDFSGVDLFSENGGVCNGNIVSGTQILDNEHSGLRLMAFGADTECTGNLIQNNTIMRNGNQMPSLSVQGLSGGQANGNLLVGNHVAENAAAGIYLNASTGGTSRGNVIRDSYVANNSSDGIRLFGGTEGTRVENNTVVGHATGYTIGSTSAFVLRNVSLNSGTSFSTGTGNLVAPVISASGELATPNAWANFSR